MYQKTLNNLVVIFESFVGKKLRKNVRVFCGLFF